ncbi:MAG: helix-turn-helix transcriptional regulator [Planctomycetes bacterium]|nr:helix-turn-helix transcriptional regulator [Planctomycetota bacterium]
MNESKTPCCPVTPELAKRSLLTEEQALDLESTFKMLANNTRLRMLHALARGGELCVTDLAETVGMKQQAVSNQLQRLADRGIVEPRRSGLQIYYHIIDPCVISLLDYAWCVTKCSSMRASERVERGRAAT